MLLLVENNTKCDPFKSMICSEVCCFYKNKKKYDFFEHEIGSKVLPIFMEYPLTRMPYTKKILVQCFLLCLLNIKSNV